MRSMKRLASVLKGKRLTEITPVDIVERDKTLRLASMDLRHHPKPRQSTANWRVPDPRSTWHGRDLSISPAECQRRIQ